MPSEPKDEIRAVWKQNDVPVILRMEDGHPLRIKLPGDHSSPHWRFSAVNWIRQDRHTKPKWDARYKCWEIPKKWLNEMVSQALRAYKRIYLIQPYREQEKCARQCVEAKGHECQCSCMGANHGSGALGSGWFEVSDTFASKWGERHLACRMMVLKR